jgi:hypothetical protein
MNRFLILFAALCPWLFAAERPNVIVILSDDLGWGSVGCYGGACPKVCVSGIWLCFGLGLFF